MQHRGRRGTAQVSKRVGQVTPQRQAADELRMFTSAWNTHTQDAVRRARSHEVEVCPAQKRSTAAITWRTVNTRELGDDCGALHIRGCRRAAVGSERSSGHIIANRCSEPSWQVMRPAGREWERHPQRSAKAGPKFFLLWHESRQCASALSSQRRRPPCLDEFWFPKQTCSRRKERAHPQEQTGQPYTRRTSPPEAWSTS